MKKKNIETKNKKITILGIIFLVVTALIIAGLYLNSSLAIDTSTSNFTDENHVELDCKEYISFENELTCKVSVIVASNQEISSINLKLSDIPGTIENLLDSGYESTILNEGEYVDVVFGNDIITKNNPIKLDVANVTFDNVTEEKLITTSQVFFLNSNYAIVDQNMKVTNPTVAAVLPVFDIKVIPSGPLLIDDKYYYTQTHNSLETLHNTVIKELTSYNILTIEGCSYNVSDDGQIITITDDYGNNKILKVIYVYSNVEDPMLTWTATENMYTRGIDNIGDLREIIYTNGCLTSSPGFNGTGNRLGEISLYGDFECLDLIDTRNWHYIESDVYDFTNTVVNIPKRVSYEEFINNVDFYGITGVLYDSNGNEITGGYLDKTNKLTVSGIPGWGTEDITINTEISDYIEIKNTNMLENSENNYIMYNIPSNITIKDFLNNIETNGVVKVYDENDRLLSAYGGFISTNMSIEITLSDKTVHYDISVLGDVVGKGTVYLSDVVKLYKIHRGKIEPTQAEMLAGDVVSDNNIDLLDVAKLYRYYRGVEESLNGNINN